MVLPHSPRLRNYLIGLLKSEDAVDDIIQEAFARMLALKNPTEIRQPKSFLFRVAHNLVVQDQRKQKTAATYTVANPEEFAAPDETPSIEERLIARERLQAFFSAVDSLPLHWKRILVLRTAYNLPHQMIADKLGISRSGVEKKFAAGMRRCREHIRAHDAISGDGLLN